eukprot:5425321-Alexandrium_andersonii.AAC.1
MLTVQRGPASAVVATRTSARPPPMLPAGPPGPRLSLCTSCVPPRVHSKRPCMPVRTGWGR